MKRRQVLLLLVAAPSSTLAQQRGEPARICGDTYFLSQARLSRLPSAHTIGDYADAAGLMAFGPDIPDNFRRAADKILKGVKTGELPIEQPAEFELVRNLRTVKALGVRIPPALRVRTDRMIE